MTDALKVLFLLFVGLIAIVMAIPALVVSGYRLAMTVIDDLVDWACK